MLTFSDFHLPASSSQESWQNGCIYKNCFIAKNFTFLIYAAKERLHFQAAALYLTLQKYFLSLPCNPAISFIIMRYHMVIGFMIQIPAQHSPKPSVGFLPYKLTFMAVNPFGIAVVAVILQGFLSGVPVIFRGFIHPPHIPVIKSPLPFFKLCF